MLLLQDSGQRECGGELRQGRVCPWLGCVGRASSPALLKLPVAGRKREASLFNPVPGQGWEWASLGTLHSLPAFCSDCLSLWFFSLSRFLQGSVCGPLSVPGLLQILWVLAFLETFPLALLFLLFPFLLWGG